MNTFLLLAALITGNQQGGNENRATETPEHRQKMTHIAKIQNQADALIKAGEYTQAIPLLKSTFALYQDAGYKQYSNPYWLLTKAYRGLGDIESANAAFKKGIYKGKDGFSFPPMVADYSMFLASQNRLEEAKMLAYVRLNSSFISDDMPAPILIAFDPDPYAGVWAYTPARFEAVNKVIQSLGMSGEFKRELKAASQLFPEWYYPYLLLATYTYNEEVRLTLFEQAEQLARTQREKQWVINLREAMSHPQIEWRERIKSISNVRA